MSESQAQKGFNRALFVRWTVIISAVALLTFLVVVKAVHNKQPNTLTATPVSDAPSEVSPPPAPLQPPDAGTVSEQPSATASPSRPAAPPASRLQSAPFAKVSWWVDPASPAAVQVAGWAKDKPAEAAVLNKIAQQPQADWFGDWSGPDIVTAVRTRAAGIEAAGAMPVFVVYNIVGRDCGHYSKGGAANAEAYRRWIRGVAKGIGAHPAVLIVEPDALAALDCLPEAAQAERYELLRYAMVELSKLPRTTVYLDAGNSGWQPAEKIAERLKRAGVYRGQGFALNVSNFDTTAASQAYGDKVSALTAGSHYVIDTSRNGAGPTADRQWCNPPGRALGQPPTGYTGNPRNDALLWIKHPGLSDGSCAGAPPAGTWWPEYALGLAQRAGW